MTTREQFITRFVLIAILSVLAVRGTAATTDDDFFNKRINQIVKLEATPLTAAALEEVFVPKFYKITVELPDLSPTAVFARIGDDIFPLVQPTTDQDMPDLLKYFKSSFQLNSDDDAKSLQQALMLLYLCAKDNPSVMTIRHTGNDWTFIYDKFFENYSGFIFTTDDKGTIIAAKYSLQIPK